MKISVMNFRHTHLFHQNTKADNRMQRYEKRLLREAFEKAKREDRSCTLYDFRVVKPDDRTLYLHASRDMVDITSLLGLVRDDFPALYRKYMNARETLQI